jgi:hypothetical protein
VSALAGRDLFDAGPAIAGDRVLFGVARDDEISFRSAPLAGGRVARLPDLSARGLVDGWSLAADAGRLAVEAYVLDRHARGHAVLYTAALGSAPRVLADPVATLASVQRQSLFVAGSQVVTIETARARLVVRDVMGGRSEVTLPRGAQPALAAISGSLVAVPVKTSASRAIVVLDRTTGSVIRRVPIDPRFGHPYALGVGPDGSLVYLADIGFEWSPAGSARFVNVAADPELVTPVIRDDKLAYSEMLPGTPLVRPVVIELPATVGRSDRQIQPRILFEGPPTEHVRSLDFDGAHLAWSTTTCQLTSPVPAPSTHDIPSGPCIRSDASFLGFGPQRPTAKRPWLRLGVTCATASDGACHLTIRAYQGPPLARARVNVAVGQVRKVVRIHLSRRALHRVQQHPDQVVLTATLRDPSGRAYTNSYLP